MAASIPHYQYMWSPESSYTAFTDSIQNSCMFNTNNFMAGGLLSSSDHSPVSIASFPHDQFLGVQDMIAAKLLSEWDMANMGLCQHDFPYCSSENIDYYHGFDHQAGAGDFVPMGTITTNSWPDYHMPSDAHNRGIQFEKPEDVIKIEEGAAAHTARIGRYSIEERRNKIHKYIKKRNQRNFNKTIKYACRKTLADKRVRIRGRFARNNDSSSGDDQQIVMNSNIHTSYQQNMMNTSLFYDDYLQMMYNGDDEEWFKGAAAGAAYFPFTAGSQFSTK